MTHVSLIIACDRVVAIMLATFPSFLVVEEIGKASKFNKNEDCLDAQGIHRDVKC